MKTKLIALILILTCTLAFAQEAEYLSQMNGHDWVKMSPDEKVLFINGFMLAAWAITYLLNPAFGFSQEFIDYISFSNVNDLDMIKEIDRFYTATRNYDMPLGIAVFERLKIAKYAKGGVL